MIKPHARLLNLHHFKSKDDLPDNTIIIDRTTRWGNPYRLESGKYSREECVGLHRISTYENLIKDTSYLLSLKAEMAGKNLACWCSNDKAVIACHGMNYLHILNDNKAYDKSVFNLLIYDLRLVLKKLNHRIMNDVSNETFLSLYIYLSELRLEINDLLSTIKKRKNDFHLACACISYIVIDLECALLEKDKDGIDYRFSHAVWQCHRYIDDRDDRQLEPVKLSIKRVKKGA